MAFKRPRSVFGELDAAYRKGKRAAVAGKPLSSNPYKKPTGSRTHTNYSAWTRGWLAGMGKLRQTAI